MTSSEVFETSFLCDKNTLEPKIKTWGLGTKPYHWLEIFAIFEENSKILELFLLKSQF